MMTETPDTYRAGDEDFEIVRARFYAMVDRHLRNVPNEPFAVPGRKRKAKPPTPAPEPAPGRDGQIYERVRVSSAQDKARNDATDMLTYLAVKGKLNSEIVPPRSDAKIERSWQDGRQRQTTANRLQEIFQLAELTPLRSPDPAAVGGGGFGPKYIGVAKIQAMQFVQDLRADIPAPCMSLLESLLMANRLERGATPAAERRILQQVRMALDFAHWSMHRSRPAIDPYDDASAELCQRWSSAFEWITARRLIPITQSVRRLSPDLARHAKEESA